MERKIILLFLFIGIFCIGCSDPVSINIEKSKLQTFLTKMDTVVDDVEYMIEDGEFIDLVNPSQNTIYYIPVSNVEDKSCVDASYLIDPYGELEEAYVVVYYNKDNSFDYYFTFYDDGGYGMALTDLSSYPSADEVIINPSPVDSSNITKQKINSTDSIAIMNVTTCQVD